VVARGLQGDEKRFYVCPLYCETVEGKNTKLDKLSILSKSKIQRSNKIKNEGLVGWYVWPMLANFHLAKAHKN